MKKLFVFAVAAVCAVAASAAEPMGGVFRHLGIGVGVGTPGIQIEASTPITKWVTLRAGVAIMPSIKFNSEVDANVTDPATGTSYDSYAELEGNLGRTQGLLIFNFYPFPKAGLYIAAGAYFAGDKLVKISGYSPELAQYGGSVVIGDYTIPANAKGQVDGGIKVNAFRPYLGIGWGRAVPGRRVNFNLDLGVQIHGTPKLYTEYGDIDMTQVTDDNTFHKIMDKVKVYPTLNFRLGFRAF